MSAAKIAATAPAMRMQMIDPKKLPALSPSALLMI